MLNSVMEYYKKRLKRIAPGYWLTIILGIVVSLLIAQMTGGNIAKISTRPVDVAVNFLLMNGLVPTSANNGVVRGGWFIGTLVILYLLTPFFTSFFYKIQSKKSFPFKVFAICALVLIFAGLVDERLACRNNSFFYFSFVNQAACFILGFLLKDMYLRDELKLIKHPVLKGKVFFVVTFFLFTIGYWRFNYIIYPIVPFCMATAVFYLSCHFLSKNIRSDTKLKKILVKYGELDYAIMLIHPFIVFDLGRLILNCDINIPHVVLFLVLIPIWLIVIYWISKIYSLLIAKVSGVLFG